MQSAKFRRPRRRAPLPPVLSSWCLLLLVTRSIVQGQVDLNEAPQIKMLQVDSYPQNALQCWSSMTETSEQLICPEFATSFCVKEVSTLGREDCGRTTYFADKWNSKKPAQCELRKCAATCQAESWDFIFEGKTYSRSRFCCENNFCNAVEPRWSLSNLVWSGGATLVLMMMNAFL